MRNISRNTCGTYYTYVIVENDKGKHFSNKRHKFRIKIYEYSSQTNFQMSISVHCHLELVDKLFPRLIQQNGPIEKINEAKCFLYNVARNKCSFNLW